METWQTILLALGGNAALLAVLGWLAKSLVEKLLTQDIERFKSSLASETSAAVERLKHDLQLVSMEHQVRFTKLHEKRAEVVAELYGLLIEACWESSSFASPAEWAGEPNKKEKYITAMNSLASFFRFFDKHRIYLPHALCGQLETLTREMRSKVLGFGGYVRYNDDALPPAAWERKQAAWDAAWEYFEKHVPAAREALEADLRSILGDQGPRSG